MQIFSLRCTNALTATALLSVTLMLTGGCGDVFESLLSRQARFAATTQSVSEADGAVSVRVELDAAATRDIVIPVVVAGGSATIPEDATVAPTAVAIASGTRSGEITISINDDRLHEEDETLELTLGAADGVEPQPGGRFTLTITDNDAAPSPAIAITDAATTEGPNAMLELAVSLSQASSLPVTVSYATADATAAAGEDYLAAADTLTFAPGEVAKSIAVVVLDDALREQAETLTVTLSSPGNAVLGRAEAVGTIYDDDFVPTVSVADVTASESDGSVDVIVSLSEACGALVTVDFATSDGTASAGSDYEASAGTLTFAPGVTTQTVTVALLIDGLVEGSESFFLDLASPTQATLGLSRAIATILDVDTVPELRVSTGDVAEGAGAAVFTVALSAATGLPVEVDFATSGGSATPGAGPSPQSIHTPATRAGRAALSADYAAQAVHLLFATGETEKRIEVPVVSDALDEDDETIIGSLANETNATVAVRTATATIVDDDPLPLVTVTGAALAEGDSGLADALLAVSLDAASGRAVTVSYATVDVTAREPGDYTAVAGDLVIPAGATSATIAVPIAGDEIEETDETLRLDVLGVINATAATDHALVTILDDDDQPGVELALAADSQPESAGTLHIRVELTAASGVDVTVPLTVSGEAVGGGVDYTLSVSSVTISAGATFAEFPLAIADDDLDENDEALVIALGTPIGALPGNVMTHTLTIVDNDDPPTVTLELDKTVNEADGEVTIAVQLTGRSENAFSVPFTVNGTATEGADADYTIDASPILVPATASSATITVTVQQDTIDEPDETVVITLDALTYGTLGAATTHTLTIQDDGDVEPTVSFASTSQQLFENDAAGKAMVTAVLSGVSGWDVTVPLSTSGTATGGGVDYTAPSSVTIPAGATSADAEVTLVDEQRYESDETVVLTIDPTPSHATRASPYAHTVTVQNDDGYPLVSFSAAGATVGEGVGTVTLRAELDAVSVADVSVPYSLSSNSAIPGAGNDYTVSPASPLTIAAGSDFVELTITVNDDSDAESSETATITIGDPTNGRKGTPSAYALIINDNETLQGPTLLSAGYHDVDGDGHLDHVALTFDAKIDDSSFDAFTTGAGEDNMLHPVVSNWIVASRDNVRLDTRDSIGDAKDDTVVWLAFDEISTEYDTGDTPELTASASTLKGVNGCYIQSGLACTTPLATIGQATVDESDAAAPIIIKASGIIGSDLVTVFFSEPVDSERDGVCAGSLVPGDFFYDDVAAGNAGAIASLVEADACGDNHIWLRTDAPVETTDLDRDTLAAADATSIYDAVSNAMQAQPVLLTAANPPYVVNVASAGPRKIRITYSEPVDATAAMDYDSYSLAEDPAQVGCSGSGADVVGLATTVAITQASPSEYVLTTNADQCSSTTYRLTATAAITDVDEGADLREPTSGTFLGAERLRILSAECQSDRRSVKVTFNKDVQQSVAQVASHYKLLGPTNLGAITGAVRDAAQPNVVTLTHAVAQTGAMYTVLGDNNVNGDGFDDGAGYDATGLALYADGTPSDTLAAQPGDRTLWRGCGTAVDSFDQGPVLNDPFVDGTDFGYLTAYNNMVYIGPNSRGNGASRFEPDGSNPTPLDFRINKDMDGGNAGSANTGAGAPPYVTVGHTGCTQNSTDVDLGCGPDNEDGRSLFFVGTIRGAPYIFLGGTRSAENWDYFYYTSDLDTTLNLAYIDLENVSHTQAKGVTATVVVNDNLYFGQVKYKNQRPDIGMLSFDPARGAGSYCVAGLDCNVGVQKGERLMMEAMPYIGSSPTDTTTANWAYFVGIDSFINFKGRIYTATGGHHKTGHNGSIIRSQSTAPGPCGTTCPWDEIAPRSVAEWHNAPTMNRWSLELVKTQDIIPGDKAFAQFAEFNGRLYLTRTVCRVAEDTATVQDGAAHEVPGCTDGTDTNRGAQLWKCDAGLTGDSTLCDAADFSLVANNGSGETSFGEPTNRTMSFLVDNGTQLYVGFDNTTGVRIYRTRAGITNPGVSPSDWEQVGAAGLGDPANVKELYSGISLQLGTDRYLYVSAGHGGIPVRIFRQVNQ